MSNVEELRNRFEYHPPKDKNVQLAHESVRIVLYRAAESLDSLLPESREKSLAITKLEEAMFWANASIARDGFNIDD